MDIHRQSTVQILDILWTAGMSCSGCPLDLHRIEWCYLGRGELIDLIEKRIGYERRLEVVKREVDQGKDEEAEKDKQNEDKEDIRRKIFDRYNVSRMAFHNRSKRTKEYIEEKLTAVRICDLSRKEQHAWEEKQLDEEVDFTSTHVDPAPFQLVERTSLLKVHSLFSMMSINTAYVTAIGKLVGVVGVTELRKAIERGNSGILPAGILEQGCQEGEGLPLIEKK